MKLDAQNIPYPTNLYSSNSKYSIKSLKLNVTQIPSDCKGRSENKISNFGGGGEG